MGNAWNTFLFLAAACFVCGGYALDAEIIGRRRMRLSCGSYFIAAAGLVVMTGVCLLMVER